MRTEMHNHKIILPNPKRFLYRFLTHEKHTLNLGHFVSLLAIQSSCRFLNPHEHIQERHKIHEIVILLQLK